jgi:hypothetical protein
VIEANPNEITKETDSMTVLLYMVISCDDRVLSEKVCDWVKLSSTSECNCTSPAQQVMLEHCRTAIHCFQRRHDKIAGAHRQKDISDDHSIHFGNLSLSSGTRS